MIIVEIGGTVGDIESLPFLEAIRQMGNEEGAGNALIHVTLVPYIAAAGELKNQTHATLRSRPPRDWYCARYPLCRSEKPLSRELRGKIALFCNVKETAVISAQM